MPMRAEDDDVRDARFRSGVRFGIGLAAVGLALAPAVGRVVRSWPLRSAVAGTSMRPGLEPGDWLLVDPRAYAKSAPRPAELVAVPDPGEPSRWLVKRVAGVAKDGRLELLGDDPGSSTDSRTFGLVDPATVIGRPWARYWPPRRVGPVR
ncbi:MAG: nickel-type superoxide dismutase maturation protease [Candidatus Limnocylindrales bacterium]|jgi:nickel-type superoxide dismutase maturation protease